MAERDPDRSTLLAAEYVLGLMPGLARRRFERRRARDAALRAEVDAWERRLAPLVDSLAPVEPPPRLVRAILAKVSTGSQGGRTRRRGFWRGFAVGAALAAALVLVWIAIRELAVPPAPERTRTVAVLVSATAEPALVLRHTAGTGTLVAEAAALSPPPDGHAYELWVVGSDGRPRSLGLVPAQGITVLTPGAVLAAALRPGATVAVSLEPLGGSPTGGPTGPIAYQGRVLAPAD
jgi:anti-sigma-K factor RskA